MKMTFKALAVAITAVFGLAGGASAATLLSTEAGNDPFPDSIFGSLSLAKCDTGTDGASPVDCADWEDGDAPGDYSGAFDLTYSNSGSGYSFDWTFDPTGIADALFPRYVTVKQATSYQVWELDASESLGGSISTGLDDISHVSFYDGRTTVIPLPAAGWLLLAGVGGLVAMRRRKTS